MKHLKKLTLLHSNDLHGDFLVEKVDDKLVGGVSMLSGYVNKVRREEENVIYAIAGDMFQGSLIDSEFKGVSTTKWITGWPIFCFWKSVPTFPSSTPICT